MATVYIIYSKIKDEFYTGSCLNIDERLIQHNIGHFKNSFTSKTKDWTLFVKIEDLTMDEARKIENHIKSMKSTKYKVNLRKYPEISKRLKEKYSAGSSR